jgi:transcriptional regulator with PAS, ATPase and Fis domain
MSSQKVSDQQPLPTHGHPSASSPIAELKADATLPDDIQIIAARTAERISFLIGAELIESAWEVVVEIDSNEVIWRGGPQRPLREVARSEDYARRQAYRAMPSGKRIAVSIAAQAHALPSATLSKAATLCELGAELIEGQLTAQALRCHVWQSARERDAISGLLDNGLLVMSQDGHLRYINERGRQLLRIGSRLGSFEELLGFEPLIADVFRTRLGYSDRELQVSLQGHDLRLIDTAVPVFDDRGNVISVVNTFRPPSPSDGIDHRCIDSVSALTMQDLIGQSPNFARLREAAVRSAKSGAHILIHGERGTGKTTLARVIGTVFGGSTNTKIVELDCAQ